MKTEHFLAIGANEVQTFRRSEIIVAVFVVFFSVVAPVAGLFMNTKYLMFFYFLIALPYLGAQKTFPTFKRNWVISGYFVLVIISIIFHIEVSSIINLISLFAGVYVISLVSKDFAKMHTQAEIARFLWKVMFYCAALVFLLSTIMTAIKVRGAPEYYFWESFFDKTKRMLLIDAGAGQTMNTWLLCWGFIYMKGAEIRAGWQTVARDFVVFVVLSIFMIYTKNRLAYLFILLMFIAFIYNFVAIKITRKRRLFGVALGSTLFLLIVIYILLPFNPGLHRQIMIIANNIQSTVPDLRVYSQGHGLTTGRDVLNFALFRTSMYNPLVGQGNNAPILLYGVTKSGLVASLGNSVASSESPFRLAVKYGWPFFIVSLMLLLAPIIAARKQEQLSMTGHLIMLSSISTFFFEGAMDNYHGLSAIILLFSMIFYFKIKGV